MEAPSEKTAAAAAPPRAPTVVPVAKIPKPHSPSTMSMVLEALKVLDEKKGVSVFAIKRYITHTYPSVNPIRLKCNLKVALVKGLERGLFVRPRSYATQGATGRFKLAKENGMPRKADKKAPAAEGEGLAAGAAKRPAEKVKKPKAKLAAAKPKAKAGADGEEKKPAGAAAAAAPGKRGAEAEGSQGAGKAPAKPKSTESKAPKKPPLPKEPREKAPPKGGAATVATKGKAPNKQEGGDGQGPVPAQRAKAAKQARAKGKPEAKEGPAKGRAKAEAGGPAKKPKAKKEAAGGASSDDKA